MHEGLIVARVDGMLLLQENIDNSNYNIINETSKLINLILTFCYVVTTFNMQVLLR